MTINRLRTNGTREYEKPVGHKVPNERGLSGKAVKQVAIRGPMTKAHIFLFDISHPTSAAPIGQRIALITIDVTFADATTSLDTPLHARTVQSCQPAG